MPARDRDPPASPNRLSNALRAVAASAGYDKAMPAGHGRGLACHRSFNSYVATAVHVVVRDDGSLHIPQVNVAIDCGRYVNPEGIRKQIEGAVVYGHTIARHGKITTNEGAVVQSNFHDYPVTRMTDAPLDVRVEILDDFPFCNESRTAFAFDATGNEPAASQLVVQAVGEFTSTDSGNLSARPMLVSTCAAEAVECLHQ